MSWADILKPLKVQAFCEKGSFLLPPQPSTVDKSVRDWQWLRFAFEGIEDLSVTEITPSERVKIVNVLTSMLTESEACDLFLRLLQVLERFLTAPKKAMNVVRLAYAPAG